MFTKKFFATATIATALFASSATQAQEVSLESMVSHIVESAVIATQQEIQFGIQEAVLTASNMFDIDAQNETLLAKVEIKDLPAEQDSAESKSE